MGSGEEGLGLSAKVGARVLDGAGDGEGGVAGLCVGAGLV
jgi:hypothetical protein